MGMGGIMIGLFIVFMMMAPSTSMRGFLPLLLIFFGPAVFALLSRRSAAPVERRYDTAADAELHGEKPKRGESLAEMMSVLSDEELEDLHRRVKQRLANDIDNASIDDVATFDELLTQEKEKRQ